MSRYCPKIFFFRAKYFWSRGNYFVTLARNIALADILALDTSCNIFFMREKMLTKKPVVNFDIVKCLPYAHKERCVCREEPHELGMGRWHTIFRVYNFTSHWSRLLYGVFQNEPEHVIYRQTEEEHDLK